jgi:hypothetical protein
MVKYLLGTLQLSCRKYGEIGVLHKTKINFSFAFTLNLPSISAFAISIHDKAPTTFLYMCQIDCGQLHQLTVRILCPHLWHSTTTNYTTFDKQLHYTIPTILSIKRKATLNVNQYYKIKILNFTTIVSAFGVLNRTYMDSGVSM